MNTIELLKRFGERNFKYPIQDLEVIINAYNVANEANQKLGRKRISIELPLTGSFFESTRLSKIHNQNSTILGQITSPFFPSGTHLTAESGSISSAPTISNRTP